MLNAGFFSGFGCRHLMHSLQQLLGIAVPNLCIIAKKRVKRQNLNTASILLTYVENALEGQLKERKR